MARFSAKGAAFYAIPVAIGGVAVYFALHRNEPDSAEQPTLRVVSPCAPGRLRCRGATVETTTGDENADAKTDRCLWRTVGACTKKCVADGVTLAGVSEDVAKVQLCDLPAATESLITDAKNFLGDSTQQAASCEGDGFQPTNDGIQQCILRSVVDPNALGVVVTSAKCRLGSIATLDRAPRLIARGQAIAIWCKRDPAALEPADAAPLDAGDAGDAGKPEARVD